MQICRIRLSDKTSRLQPRRAATELGQAYEPEVPVKVREWISSALASPDLVLEAQPPAQPHSRVIVERPICFAGGANIEVIGPSAQREVQLFHQPCGLLPSTRSVGQRVDVFDHALDTICEALAKAACRVLQIESTEILAEYRPALTDAGANGLETEVFIYDTLAGGAGFSPQLVGRGQELFEEAVKILADCPERCDASCYRCLRSFRNKLDHRLLDRKLGEQLLRHALCGGYPAYPQDRVEDSLNLLFTDGKRQLSDQFELERNVNRLDSNGQKVVVPIIVRRHSHKEETWVTLSSPIAPDVPVGADLRAAVPHNLDRIVCIDDLLVRRNLPAAMKKLFSSLQ
jgi:hypothetical protein